MTGLATVFTQSKAVLLDYLIEHPKDVLSISDLSRQCGVSWRTTQPAVHELELIGVITITNKEYRNGYVVQLNKKSEVTRLLMRLHDALETLE